MEQNELYYEDGGMHDIKYFFIWRTKFRRKVIRGPIARRLRELLIQECKSKKIKIISGSIGINHVHMFLSCPTSLSPSKIAQSLKGRSSRMLQAEFRELKEEHWGQGLWADGYFCSTVGSVSDDELKNYIGGQQPDPAIQ